MKKEDFLILAAKIADGNPTDEEILIYNTYLNQVQNEEHAGMRIQWVIPN